ADLDQHSPLVAGRRRDPAGGRLTGLVGVLSMAGPPPGAAPAPTAADRTRPAHRRRPRTAAGGAALGNAMVGPPAVGRRRDRHGLGLLRSSVPAAEAVRSRRGGVQLLGGSDV